MIPNYHHLRKQKKGTTTTFNVSPLVARYFDKNLLSVAVPRFIYSKFRSPCYHNRAPYKHLKNDGDWRDAA